MNPIPFPPEPAAERRPLADRFWEKVEKTATCWLFRGAITTAGYGHISVGGRAGRLYAAHRVVWELERGPIPAGMFVLHRCDVRACVNPEHLFLGTLRDNAADMWAKGRAGGQRRMRVAIAPLWWLPTQKAVA